MALTLSPAQQNPARRQTGFRHHGRDIVVFHVNGEFFALLNRSRTKAPPLDKAACVARLTRRTGVYPRSRS